MALGKANLRCICVEEARMAMTILTENQFDLIFLDAEMPEMNGFELCAELRKTATNKATPVIFVTSLTNFEVRAQSSLAGANDLIAKPFLMMELAVKSLTYLLRPKSIVDIKSQPGGGIEAGGRGGPRISHRVGGTGDSPVPPGHWPGGQGCVKVAAKPLGMRKFSGFMPKAATTSEQPRPAEG